MVDVETWVELVLSWLLNFSCGGGWWVGVENEIKANLSFQLSCSWSWSLSLAKTSHSFKSVVVSDTLLVQSYSSFFCI